MTENITLREKLSGLLSTARERKALGASALRMYLHEHHVCSRNPTVSDQF